MSILNKRIKERRIATGKTLLEVAEHIGVKEATMQRYESGQIKNIKHETISAIADFLCCTPSFLMGWDEAPVSTPASTGEPLSSDEARLLELYRSLNNQGKEYILQTIDLASDRYKKDYCSSDVAASEVV